MPDIGSIQSESDETLYAKICAALDEGVAANPYSEDGSFAEAIRRLPAGLRAMAATHWLDLSLTLDEIGWRFLNFGEPGLVEETEKGLRELGLDLLANYFAETYEIVRPLRETVNNGDQDYEALERIGKSERIDELSRLAWELESDGETFSDSVIYGAWLRYVRAYPERVFPHRETDSGQN